MSARHHIASPNMINSFIGAVFGAFSVLTAIGNLGSDALLAMGVLRLLLGTILFLGALINIFKGIPSGNLNLISAVCFGLFAGVHITISTLGFHGVSWQPLIYCIVQLFGGIYILLILPALLDTSLYAWVCQMSGAFGLLHQAIFGMTSLGFFRFVSGFWFLFYAILNTYAGLAAVIPDLPQGPDTRLVIGRLYKAKKSNE